MEWIQINKITDERREITTNTTEIQRIIRQNYEKILCQQIGQSRRNG